MSAATLIRAFSKKLSGTIAKARRAEKAMKNTSNQRTNQGNFLRLVDNRMDGDLGWGSRNVGLTVKDFG